MKTFRNAKRMVMLILLGTIVFTTCAPPAWGVYGRYRRTARRRTTAVVHH